MTTNCTSFTDLSDHALLAAVQRLAGDERHATAQLIASLAELDARRLSLGEGCSSLYTYCTQVLHLSEHAAYGRIEARAARRFPAILERLAAGEITLTAIGLLAPQLTPDNYGALLDAVRHRSKRDVERLIATLRPQEPVPSSVRRLPSPVHPSIASNTSQPRERALVADPPSQPPAAMSAPQPSARPAVIRPLAPERYRVQFTMPDETFHKLRRAQDLMRHRVLDGDVAVIFDRALTLLLEHLDRTKLAAVRRPHASSGAAQRSRNIPAAVRRQVWTRDEGRCAFAGPRGRCTERGYLEFHHVVPYAAGGKATAENIELRCRAHNQYEAEQYFRGEPPLIVRECPLLYWSGN